MAPPPHFGGRGGSTELGSTFQAEVNCHKSGQVLHFGFKNSVLGPQHTFPLLAVLLESCGIIIFPSTSEKFSSLVSLHAVFAPYKAGKAVALVAYALHWHLGGPRFKSNFPQTGKFYTFPAIFNLMGLSNAHTKCMETLLVFKLVISTLFTPRVMMANTHTHTHKFHGNMGTWVMIVTTVPNLEC